MRAGHRVGTVLLAVLALAAREPWLCAEQPAWQPSLGHTQVPIWPGTAPDAGPVADAEAAGVAEQPVAGRPWVYVGNVSRPTMTVYSPTEENTCATVVVFPGGGYQVLAIERRDAWLPALPWVSWRLKGSFPEGEQQNLGS